MKPSNLGCGAAATELPSLSTSSSTSDWRQLRGGGGASDGGSSPLSPSLPRDILRGGSTQTAGQNEGYEYVEDDDGYFYADEDGDGEGVEYEYYEDDDGNEDGYYYEEYYEGEDGDNNEDGYIYLPDPNSEEAVADGTRVKKKRNLASSIGRSLGPITSKATLSITGALPAAIPNAVSNLSRTVSASLGQMKLPSYNIDLAKLPNSLKELDSIQAGSIAVLSIVTLAVVARALSAAVGNTSLWSSDKNKGKKKRKNRKMKSPKQKNMRRKFFWKGKGEKSVNEPNADKGDTDYLGGDDETMDLDLVDNKTSGSRKQKRFLRMLFVPRSPLAKIVPSISARDMMQDAWNWTCALGSRCRPSSLRLGLGGSKRGSVRKASAIDTSKEPAKDAPMPEETPAKPKVADSGAEVNAEVMARAEELQQDLDTLTESHHSLEQEYEASLRMLHEARIQLRQLQQKQQQNSDDADNSDGSDSMQQKHKQQMEALVQKMEAKYKTQMKEQMERLRSQLEGKLRTELETKVTEELTSQFQSQMKKEQTQMEEQLQKEMEQRLSRSKEVQKSELDSNFKQAVNEAAALEVDKILDEAIQNAVNEERKKSREEMLRVRAGIQKVLERERTLMKEQVRRATGQVRDWLAREQREQLLQQAKQLQEEAERYGGGGSRGAQRGGRGTAGRNESMRGRGAGPRPSGISRGNTFEQ